MKSIEEIRERHPRAIERAGCIFIPDYDDPTPENVAEFEKSLTGLNWITKKTARHEYFMSDKPREYSYGNAHTGQESYSSQPFSLNVAALLMWLNDDFGTRFNVCFLNKYDNEQQHLGWHADEFPGMIKEEPIIVVSFGAAREIWVKDKRGFPAPCPQCGGCGYYSTETMARYGDEPEDCPMCEVGKRLFWQKEPPKKRQPDDQRFMLTPASVFIMPPGYQETHLHRIPKHDRPCGPRISLTFRSFE